MWRISHYQRRRADQRCPRPGVRFFRGASAPAGLAPLRGRGARVRGAGAVSILSGANASEPATNLMLRRFMGVHPFDCASDRGACRATMAGRAIAVPPCSPMIEVTFRFYAQLNDFLPAGYRRRRLRRPIRSQASVKDAIEALGVPHPEVHVLLVNGKSEGFEYLLKHGDDVSAYPVFQSIDVAGLPPVGSAPPQPIRFVLDAHLGKLASLLRLCGFDAVLLADDVDVANVSAREGRVALTRDVGLLKRSIVVFGYWVRQTAPERQLTEILERFDLAGQIQPFARCLRCNTLLAPVAADAVARRLPPRTRTAFQHFHHCPGCGRVYWQGSHYGRLAALIERVRARLSARPGESASDERGFRAQ